MSRKYRGLKQTAFLRCLLTKWVKTLIRANDSSGIIDSCCTHGLHNCKDQRAAAAAFISVNSISQRKIKHQYDKTVQLNTAVQIGCFQHLYLT